MQSLVKLDLLLPMEAFQSETDYLLSSKPSSVTKDQSCWKEREIIWLDQTELVLVKDTTNVLCFPPGLQGLLHFSSVSSSSFFLLLYFFFFPLICCLSVLSSCRRRWTLPGAVSHSRPDRIYSPNFVEKVFLSLILSFTHNSLSLSRSLFICRNIREPVVVIASSWTGTENPEVSEEHWRLSNIIKRPAFVKNLKLQRGEKWMVKVKQLCHYFVRFSH